jgi:hypothetical protein
MEYDYHHRPFRTVLFADFNVGSINYNQENTRQGIIASAYSTTPT